MAVGFTGGQEVRRIILQKTKTPDLLFFFFHIRSKMPAAPIPPASGSFDTRNHYSAHSGRTHPAILDIDDVEICRFSSRGITQGFVQVALAVSVVLVWAVAGAHAQSIEYPTGDNLCDAPCPRRRARAGNDAGLKAEFLLELSNRSAGVPIPPIGAENASPIATTSTRRPPPTSTN